jgi:hypothetical protein
VRTRILWGTIRRQGAATVPESKGRSRPKSRRPADREFTPAAKPGSNPPWFVPLMVGLMIFGTLWVATFYVTSGDWPAPIGYWNLVIGLGAIMAGFVMATRWR